MSKKSNSNIAEKQIKTSKFPLVPQTKNLVKVSKLIARVLQEKIEGTLRRNRRRRPIG